ncbi:MAG: alanine:cation symporter family protein, partial [Raoultibacter sp.]
AFNFQSIFGGFAGSVVVTGIKRGLFSNEAGMGSAPNAAASASVSHPCKQGLVQVLSVFIDTIVICTCTAMMILVFFVNGDPGTLNGMPLVQQAINSSVGEMGIHFVTFSIFAFAFSSLIGNYFYAESNIKFIKNNKVVLFVFRISCLVAIFMGAQSNFDLAWNIADIVMGAMAFVNIVAIVLLGKWAFRALDDYTAQRKAGKDPVFYADSIPGLPPTQCWHETAEELAENDRKLEAEHAL